MSEPEVEVEETAVDDLLERAKQEQIRDWLAFTLQVNEEHWVPPVHMLASEAVPWRVTDIEDTWAEAWLYDIFQGAVSFLVADHTEDDVTNDVVFRSVAEVTPLDVPTAMTIFAYMRAWQQPWRGDEVAFPQEVWNKLVLIGLELFRKLSDPVAWQRFAQAYTDRQGLIWDNPMVAESSDSDSGIDPDDE